MNETQPTTGETIDNLWDAVRETVAMVSDGQLDILFFADQEWQGMGTSQRADFHDDICVWIEEEESMRATLRRALRYVADSI